MVEEASVGSSILSVNASGRSLLLVLVVWLVAVGCNTLLGRIQFGASADNRFGVAPSKVGSDDASGSSARGGGLISASAHTVSAAALTLR